MEVALVILGGGFLVLLIGVIALAAFGIKSFNTLRSADVTVSESLAGIDVQLTRRADLIPNLVQTVKGYAKFERSVLDEVTSARARVATAAERGSVTEKAEANADMDRALVNVLQVAENYPDLKANENFQSLMGELRSTEDKLSFARQYYNDAVATLNKTVTTFPHMLIAGPAGVSEREFYTLPEGTSTEAPQIEF